MEEGISKFTERWFIQANQCPAFLPFYRITEQSDRRDARILDSSVLFGEEMMLTLSGKQEKSIVEAEILNTRYSFFLTATALEFGNTDLVFLQDYLVNFERVFSIFDVADDIKPVTALNVTNSGLLNKSTD